MKKKNQVDLFQTIKLDLLKKRVKKNRRLSPELELTELKFIQTTKDIRKYSKYGA